MNLAEEKAAIATTVLSLRSKFGIPVDPARRGPVSLARFLDECNLLHVVLEKLTRAEIAKYLLAEGIDPGPLDQDDKANDPLAGFLLTTGSDGFVFASEKEPTQRKEGEEQKLQATSLGRRNPANGSFALSSWSNGP